MTEQVDARGGRRNRYKGKLSLVLYAVAIPISLAHRWVAMAVFVAVAIMWLIPDRRIERILGASR